MVEYLLAVQHPPFIYGVEGVQTDRNCRLCIEDGHEEITDEAHIAFSAKQSNVVFELNCKARLVFIVVNHGALQKLHYQLESLCTQLLQQTRRIRLDDLNGIVQLQVPQSLRYHFTQTVVLREGVQEVEPVEKALIQENFLVNLIIYFKNGRYYLFNNNNWV